jgi:adenosine deaminase
MTNLSAFIGQLPKAELHVHLEGCLEAELLFELAERNDVALPWRSAAALRAAYQFDDLQSFLALYFQGCQVLRREQDFYQLTRDYLARAHADGVVRAECFLGPQSFTEQGVPIQAVIEGTLRAMADAEREDGISAGLLVSAHRHRSEADAFALLDSVLPWADQLAGFGLGGAEVGNPPEKFTRYFAELHRLGQATTAHAGEEGPADYVRQAVELLGVDRIDHGIRALDDPQLTAELAQAKMPFTVCPISNVKLQGVESLAQHPLPRMLAAGLTVTLNSDDPAYFESSLADNYRQCAQAFDLDAAALAGLAAASLRAAFLSDEQREPHLCELAAQLAAVRAAAPAEQQSGRAGA